MNPPSFNMEHYEGITFARKGEKSVVDEQVAVSSLCKQCKQTGKCATIDGNNVLKNFAYWHQDEAGDNHCATLDPLKKINSAWSGQLYNAKSGDQKPHEVSFLSGTCLAAQQISIPDDWYTQQDADAYWNNLCMNMADAAAKETGQPVTCLMIDGPGGGDMLAVGWDCNNNGTTCQDNKHRRSTDSFYKNCDFACMSIGGCPEPLVV
jgi:hypothetical protein